MSSKLVRHTTKLPTLHRPAPAPFDEGKAGRPETPAQSDLPGLIGYAARLIVRRKWMILGITALVAGAATLQVFTMTPSYRAIAKVEIQPDAARVLPYEARSRVAEDFIATETYLQTQKEVVRSQALATRVIERLQLAGNVEFTTDRKQGVMVDFPKKVLRHVAAWFATDEDEGGSSGGNGLADHLIEDLGVEVIVNTRLLEIRYDSASPELAQLVLNTLADELIELEFANRFEATARAREFLEEQLVELRYSVDDSEASLAGYANSRNILSVDDRQQLALDKLSVLNQELTQIESQMIAERALLHELREIGADHVSSILDDGEVNEMEGRLSGLKQQLASLSARFGTHWPDTRRVQREIDEMTRQLEGERRRAIRDADERFSALQKRHAMLQAELDQQKQVASKLDRDLIQYDTLKQATSANREMYDGLLQRLQEVGVATGLKMSNVRVLDSANLPKEVNHPNHPFFLAVGLVLGLAVGVAGAFFAETLDLTVRTPEDVEQSLELRCLGVIPLVRKPAGQSGADTTGKNWSTAVTSFIELESSGAWEAYRSLRTSILYSTRHPVPRSIMIASGLPEEGRTFTAVNLAVALAQLGARVVLVDLDLRNPGISRMLGLNDGPEGMSTFLWKGYDDEIFSYIRDTDIPNVSAIPAGRRPPNPPELIGSDRTHRALETLKDGFDVVIVDTPPLLSCTDGLALSPMVDQVLTIARGGETPRRALELTHAQLEQVQARVMGVVINAADMRSPEFAYRHGSSRLSRRRKTGGLFGRIRT